jgi:serine/threonine protein kinase/TolA-binding protein
MESFPRRFGPYLLLKPLARGGMGALYLAVSGEKGLEKLCVVKTALPHLIGKGYGQRFRDEASVVVRLSHGNLATVFDAGQVEGEVFIAMDFVEGKDLRAVWNRCANKGVAFPIDIAVHIVKEISRALAYVHAFKGLRLVHRDISPPNVLLSYSGEVKITDFGLAWSTLKLEKTVPGIVFGKVSYMAPEQARGEPLDGRADIYAAGIILWELLTGRQLFPAPAGSGTDDEVLEQVRNPLVQPPSQRASRVPQVLDAIVLKALAPNPEARYQSGEDFRAQLAAFQARTAPATDGHQLARFLKDLFGDAIGSERHEREELLHRAESQLSVPTAPALPIDLLAGGPPRGRTPVKNHTRQLSTRDRSQFQSGSGEAGHETSSQLVGSLLAGRYRIKCLCGEGGMGRVYEAEHVEIGRRVAVKVLHPAYSRTPEVVERFRREARAASRAGHPNIVDVTDSGTTSDGSFFFVMEFVEGQELGLVIFKEGPLHPGRALHIAAQMCDALQAAHDAGIIHRDLKPENVLLITRDGQPDFVKVLDFGIAKSTEVEEPTSRGRRLTRPGVAMGTPEYMAPEQAAGKPADPRSDIYAVGSILYEMLAGKPPYDGDNVMEVLHKKANESPPPLRQMRPDIPEEVERLVDRAMARMPSLRPQSMAELASQMRTLRGRLAFDNVSGPMRASELDRRDSPILTGSMSVAPAGSLLGLSRRAMGVSAGLLVLLAGLVVVRATVRGRADRLRSVEAAREASSRTPGPKRATDVTVAASRPGTGPPVSPIYGPSDLPRMGPETAPARPRRAGRPARRLALADNRKLLEEGWQLYRAQRFEDARAAFIRLAQKPKTPSSAFLGLGQVAFQKQEYREAAARARQAVKAGEGIDAHLLLGDAQYRMQQYREAQKAYRDALKIDPRHETAERALKLVERQLQ